MGPRAHLQAGGRRLHTTPRSRDLALQKSLEWGDKIPTGILYREVGRPTYEEQVTALKKGPLVTQPIDGRLADYEALKNEFV